MRLFSCGACGQTVFFDNVSCTRCGASLAFDPASRLMVAVAEEGDGTLRASGQDQSAAHYRHCGNRKVHDACNWLVPANDPHDLCVACRLNRTIPDLGNPDHLVLWRRLEAEKRRLVYSLLRLGLPVSPQSEDPQGLAFDFLADPGPWDKPAERVMTGHAQGLITINIAEADPVARESMRASMGEPYRTILGHFRHESGHYYWDRLVRDGNSLYDFRSMFGDEREDYGAALQRHYAQGPRDDWASFFVSAYAASHPWEDWAETFAHYLHIVDTLDTAHAFGLKVRPRVPDAADLVAEPRYDPYAEYDFATIVDHWLPLTYALNSLNRSMGHDHAYPFVLAAGVIDKLALVHRIVRNWRGGGAGPIFG